MPARQNSSNKDSFPVEVWPAHRVDAREHREQPRVTQPFLDGPFRVPHGHQLLPCDRPALPFREAPRFAGHVVNTFPRHRGGKCSQDGSRPPQRDSSATRRPSAIITAPVNASIRRARREPITAWRTRATSHASAVKYTRSTAI